MLLQTVKSMLRMAKRKKKNPIHNIADKQTHKSMKGIGKKVEIGNTNIQEIHIMNATSGYVLEYTYVNKIRQG